MAETIEIKAAARPASGKGAARQARREGRVPGVIYGDKREAENISVDFHELTLVVAKGKFLSKLFEINVDGKKSRVIPRDVQLDPVRDFPLHVDFQRVGAGSRLRVNVPVKFVNEGASPGLKRGGVLNVVRHDIEVTCPADNIPTHFEFDLTGLEIGRSIHISATKLPDGVKTIIQGRDFTIATVAGAKAEEEVVVAAVAATPAEGDAAAAAAAAGGDAKAAAAPAKGGAAAAPAKEAKAPAGGKAPAAKK